MNKILMTMALLLLSVTAIAAPDSVSLTVYNDNFALIRENRTIKLDKGITSINIEDVASMIDPTSILFKSLTSPNGVSILEQNYKFDLISPESILNKSIGQRVTFTNFDENGKPYKTTGILLNEGGSGNAVIKTDDGKLVLRPTGQISLEKMPEGLISKPTLNWLISTEQPGENKTELSYITSGLRWNADYVVLVNKDDTKVDLAGWVTMGNQSGATYKDAKLTLMAGDVRRIQPQQLYQESMMMDYVAKAAPAPQFQEKSFFEYHMYTMERPTTIANNETKQLSLLNADAASVQKEMIYDGRGDWFKNWWYPGRTGEPGGGYDTSTYHKVNVVLVLENSKANNMGMPLPKGKVRVYKLDDNGSQQFIGEDSIDHTPKDEKIRLYIGDAFDVIGEYKRTNYSKIADNVIEESFEVKIKNHKETPVDVKVMDHAWGDWKITQSNIESTKKDATTIEFPVNVPANGEKTITYTIRVTW